MSGKVTVTCPTCGSEVSRQELELTGKCNVCGADLKPE